MSKVILGLDIGKSSLGFALVDEAHDYKPLLAGSRIFEAPETSKDQKSLNLLRGEQNRARNSNENEFRRTKKIVKTLLKHNLLDSKTIERYNKSPKVINVPNSKKKRLFYIKFAEYLYYKKSNANDILDLRVKALNQKLSAIQMARLLYSMNKHRGVTYDDIAEVKDEKTTKLSDDQKKLKIGFEKYNAQYKKNQDKYQTVGEYLSKEYLAKYRNTNNKYIFSFPRDDIKDEIEIIFEKQRKFGNPFSSIEFQEDYIESFLWEKESPRYDTLVAPCIYSNTKSANKHNFVSMLFVALEKLHNIKYRDKNNIKFISFNMEQIKTILENSLDVQKGKSYKDIKKILGLKNIEFKGVLDEDVVVVQFKTFIQLKKILDIDKCRQRIKHY